MPESESEKSRDEQRRERVEKSFDEYRKSGIALMATVIALSSGGIAALFQIADTKDLALFYFIPICLAVLQQLAHYLASKANAQSVYHGLLETHPEDDAAFMEAYIGGRVYYMHANRHFEVSDTLSWLACLALGLVSLCPLFILAKPLISAAVVGSILAVGVYWAWRWKKLQKEINEIDW